MTMPGRPARVSPGVLLVLAALGGLLFVRYEAFDAALPRGISEFAYGESGLGPLPYSAMRGFTVDQLSRHVGRLFLLGPALVLLVPAVEALLGGLFPNADQLKGLVRAGAATSLVVMAWVMGFVLHGRAIIEDELTYRLQASLLADGRLGDPAGESFPFPSRPFTIWSHAGTTGKYLFGEPVVQILGSLVHLPALLHLPLAALTLWAFHRAVRGAAGAAVAGWAMLLVAASPMFILTSAIGLSDATSLTCLAVAALGLQLAREACAGGSAGGSAVMAAALTGTALGFGLSVRPQSVAAGGVWIGLATLWVLVRARRGAAVGVLVGTGGVFLALIGLYDSAITGSATTLPWALYTPVEHWGFGPVWAELDLFDHTPLVALGNLAVTAVRFNGWWLGWPASLGLLGVWAAVGRPRAGAGPYLAMGAGIVLFYFGYYSPGVSDTGPVYYLELVLPAAVLGANAIVAAGARWPGITTAALVVHVLFGTGTFLAEHVARVERLANALHAPAEDVTSRVTTPALLIVETEPDQVRRVGWVWSGFPLWSRRASDPVVIYPRETTDNVRALIARFPDRSCWYFRANPLNHHGELSRCEATPGLLGAK